MTASGVILVNLGSPRSPALPDMRRFLGEFLMDGRVLDVPWPLRYCIVHCVILPLRARHAAAAYGKIWTPEGSPLVAISTRLRETLQDRLRLPVELAMRYGEPSILGAIKKLAACAVNRLLLVPMFPHYAMSTYETAVVRVRTIAQQVAPYMQLIVHPPFYIAPQYINALVTVARQHLPDELDHLLFSFHSLPERHLRKTDPTHRHCLVRPDCCTVESQAHATCYKHQCIKTMFAFVQTARLTPEKCSIAFQSRFGPGRWLAPDTTATLRNLARTGAKKVAVICPSFLTDCLETLEEIGIRARAEFIAAGGREFILVPCLNDHPVWVEAMTNMIKQMFDHAPAA